MEKNAAFWIPKWTEERKPESDEVDTLLRIVADKFRTVDASEAFFAATCDIKNIPFEGTQIIFLMYHLGVDPASNASFLVNELVERLILGFARGDPRQGVRSLDCLGVHRQW